MENKKRKPRLEGLKTDSIDLERFKPMNLKTMNIEEGTAQPEDISKGEELIIKETAAEDQRTQIRTKGISLISNSPKSSEAVEATIREPFVNKKLNNYLARADCVLGTELETIIRLLEGKKVHSKAEEESVTRCTTVSCKAIRKLLMPLIRDIQFFSSSPSSSQSTALSEADLQHIAGRMQFEFCEEGEDVFKYNEFGSMFYIMIKGSCSVLVQNSKKGLKRQATKRTKADSPDPFTAGSGPEQKTKRADKCKAARKIVCQFDDIQHARYEQLRLLMEETKSDCVTPGNMERQNFTAPTPVLKKSSMSYHQGLTVNELHDKWEDGCSSFDIPGLSEIVTSGLFRYVAWYHEHQCYRFGQKPTHIMLDHLCNALKLDRQQQEHLIKFILQDYVSGLNERPENKFQWNRVATLARNSQIAVPQEPIKSGSDQEESSDFSSQSSIFSNEKPLAEDAASPQLQLQAPATAQVRKSMLSKMHTPIATEIKEKINTIKRHLTDENISQQYTEVATKHAGDFFGELALITNKPRSATINCLTPCYFAVLTKSDYEESLGKIQKQQMNQMIKFLSGIPQFGGGHPIDLDSQDCGDCCTGWSKTALSRLSYYFTQTKHRRGNIVYKAGDICKSIYIVYDGEFELSKQVVVKEKADESFPHSKYLFRGINDDSAFEKKPKAQQKRKIYKPKSQFSIQCKNLGKGQMICEDAVNLVNHTKTLSCKSFGGTLLEMPVQDFYQRIKREHEETWRLICEVNTNKLIKNQVRINKIMRFKGEQQPQVQQEAPEESVCSDREGTVVSNDSLGRQAAGRVQSSLGLLLTGSSVKGDNLSLRLETEKDSVDLNLQVPSATSTALQATRTPAQNFMPAFQARSSSLMYVKESELTPQKPIQVKNIIGPTRGFSDISKFTNPAINKIANFKSPKNLHLSQFARTRNISKFQAHSSQNAITSDITPSRYKKQNLTPKIYTGESVINLGSEYTPNKSKIIYHMSKKSSGMIPKKQLLQSDLDLTKMRTTAKNPSYLQPSPVISQIIKSPEPSFLLRSSFPYGPLKPLLPIHSPSSATVAYKYKSKSRFPSVNPQIKYMHQSNLLTKTTKQRYSLSNFEAVGQTSNLKYVKRII